MPRRPKRHVLRDPAELDAVVSPARHHLLRTLAGLGTASVKELAECMGRTPESLYYHLRALEQAGLVVEGATRTVRGRAERTYATVAETLVTDPRQTSSEYLEAYGRSAAALVRLADRQLAAAIERQKEEHAPRPPALAALQVQARLSPPAQRELARRLQELTAFVLESDDPDEEQRVSLTLLSAPL